MKVFMFSSVHPWNDTRVFFKEAISLANNGYDVNLYAVENDVSYQKEIQNLNVYTLERVKRIYRPYVWLKLLKLAIQNKSDVYHFHDPELLPIGYLIKKITKSKVIYDMHEDFPAALRSKDWIPRFLRGFISQLLKIAEDFFLKRCDAIIYAEKYYKYNYKKLDKYTVDILNYPLLSDSQEPIKASSEKTSIIYAGAISKTRGIFEMLRMAQQLKERNLQFKLTIIGKFPESLKIEAEQFIETEGLNGYIELPGRLPLDQVFSYYRESDIGLAILHPEPNYIKSLATKIFEYMSVGIPVVASNFPEWKKLITDSNCGIVVNPLDTKELTNAVEQLIINKQLANDFGENGFVSYKNKFNWSIEEKKLIELYNDLTGGRH